MNDPIATGRPRRACALAPVTYEFSDDDENSTTKYYSDRRNPNKKMAGDDIDEEYEFAENYTDDEIMGTERDSDDDVPAEKKRKTSISSQKAVTSRSAPKSSRKIKVASSARSGSKRMTSGNMSFSSNVASSNSEDEERGTFFQLNEDSEDDLSIGDDDNEDESVHRSRARKPTVYKDTYKCRNGIAEDLSPVSSIEAIFGEMTDKARTRGFDNFLSHLNGRPLHVATMCSGTEAPILALNMIAKHLESQNQVLVIQHLFSAEIEPWKQSYILQNCTPSVVFRDITEFSAPKPDDSMPRTATTVYGGKAVVPGDVDLLVAGTCCVDFSLLNNKRLDIEALGESGATFFAMRSYANEYRPKIIILENVISAPWVQKGAREGMDSYMAKIGYASRFLKVDTNEFYLPQTRNRGYMICVDREAFGSELGASLDSLLTKWASSVSSFKRPASVPVEQLLLPSDDPFLRSLSGETNEHGRQRVGWDSCQLGHQDYRAQLHLGNRRPLTDWRPDGSTRNPDFHIKMSRQVERISDTLDIAHIRNVNRGFDDRYYSRNLELSQNVYRVTDSIKLGIISCLTPTGIPFNTVRGGKIIGYEAMKLQGLPVDDLDLSQLSQVNLRELAGNAMTSTVVGATILAALTIFHNTLRPNGRVPTVKKQLNLSLIGEDTLVRKEADPVSHTELSSRSTTELAFETKRLCYCEGRHDQIDTTFVQCKCCRHTACMNCSRNPKHQYEPVDKSVVDGRKNPAEFEETLKRSIPMKLTLKVFLEDFNTYRDEFILNSKLSLEDKNSALDFIMAALESEAHFRGMRRRELWEIMFESSHAKFVLTIAHDIHWLLYAKVPAALASNNPVRRFLEQFPIARMIPAAEDILEGHWHFFVPQTRAFEATITSHGKLLDSFEADRGLERFSDTFVHDQCDIKIHQYEAKYFDNVQIGGKYSLSQECGQAFNSLHVNIATQGPSPLFFYFDHQRQTGDPNDHYFVFTKDNRRLDYGEYRPIVGRVDKAWRQPKVQSDSSIESVVETHVYSDGYWSDFGSTSFDLRAGQRIIYRHISNQVNHLEKLSCNTQHAALTCQLRMNHTHSPSPNDVWIPLNRSNETAFFTEFSWILQRISVLPGHLSADLTAVDHWHQAIIDHSPSESFECTPIPPKMLWAFPKLTKGSKIPKQAPFEDPEDATNFERALKERPQPISVMYRLDSEGFFFFKLGIDPATLMHRAFARLVGTSKSQDVQTSWRLATDAINFSNHCLPQFTLMGTGNERQATQPPEFEGIISLRPEQRRKLSWMTRQEEGVPFIEREIVEARAEKLGYVLMGQASQQKVVHGGILADQVGFGKTIVTLALIFNGLKAAERFASTPVRGGIPLKATLVFVPSQISDQWANEAERFFPPGSQSRVLVIGEIRNLRTCTIRDFMDADIIIVNSVICSSDSYLLALAHLSGMVEPAQKATSRAISAWHERANEKLKESVEQLKDNPGGFNAYLESQLSKNMARARSRQLPVPSKHVTGAAYRAREKPNQHNDEDDVDTEYQALECLTDTSNLKRLGKDGWESLQCPVLEMFHFYRVVLDEYTFIDFGKCCTIPAIVAERRWGLSGTPDMNNLTALKKLASYLKINLGADDYSSMKPDVYKKETELMTSSEKLLTFQGIPSVAWQELRHAHAGVFLDTFVRRDIADISGIECSEHLCLVRPAAAEVAAYSELQQRLAATDFRKMRCQSSGSDMDKQISEILAGCADGREALLLRAAYFTIMDDVKRIQPQNSREACEAICEIRTRQYKDLEKTLLKLMDRAVWLQMQPDSSSCSSFKDWLERLQDNHFGDIECTKTLVELINEHAIADYSPGNWKYFYRTIKDVDPRRWHLELLPEGMVDGLPHKAMALKKSTKELNRIAQELVNRKRSVRFLDAVCQLQSLSANSSLPCDGCGSTTMPIQDLFLLSKCGHLLCRLCSDIREGICAAVGCDGSYENYQKLCSSQFTGQQASEGYYRHGKKLQEVVDLIINIPDEDKVLLFVQSPKLFEKVMRVLGGTSITFTSFNDSKNSANILTDFQSTKKFKVLILTIGDSSSAGSNLTIANHVIFISPYLSSGSRALQEWKAATTQAIGRAVRCGQEKHVHTYHFLASRTIDIDIFEERNGDFLRTSSVSPDALAPYQGFSHSGIQRVKAQPGDVSEFGSTVAHLLSSFDS